MVLQPRSRRKWWFRAPERSKTAISSPASAEGRLVLAAGDIVPPPWRPHIPAVGASPAALLWMDDMVQPLDGEILGADDPTGPEFEKRQERVRRDFWKVLRRGAGRIPFAEDAVAAYYCAFDRETPFRVRAILMAALAYFVLPFDAIPDFLAGIGFADDATVLMTALTLLGSHVKPAHREAARRALDREGKR